MLDDLDEIGPYRILRRIATGGMAEIYLARQRAIEGVERTVVIKQILPKHAEDDEFITMFLDEARLLAALSHPHVAQVLDVGRQGSTYYVVMEYVRGPTLGKLLARARDRGERLPRREALGITLQIAAALHYVHERRDDLGRPLDIVHRDLNPANVLVSFDGAAKLIDFGIAKAATKVYETRTGVIKGTYGYIAPEQLVGTTPVDRRADVFALGILLYEMIVGTHPFDASDEPNLVDRVLDARYPRPRSLQPDIPRDLDQLISSCLTPHPSGRPDDMRVLIDALAEHLGQHGMVPTQLGVARVVAELVPDEEGPQPLRPLTAVHRPRPFDGDPSGTRKLGLQGPDTEPGREMEEGRPGLWEDATVSLGDDEPLTLGAVRDALATHAEGDDDATRVARTRAPADPVEEAPTRLVSIDDPALRRKGADETFAPRPKKKRGVPTGLVVGGGILAMAVVGLLSFGLVRLIGAARGEEGPAPIASGPRALELAIVSEPAGATVFVDARQIDAVTPARVTLPAGTEQVWVRVVKEGFEADEREIIATAGEARFVLRPLP